MNCGVGPICRKMDNAVLARQIPSNVMAALGAFSKVSVDSVPEPARATLGEVGADLLNLSTVDWRSTCKRVEWLVSWNLPKPSFNALIEVVSALGYVSLAAMLMGESAKGKASCSFENGRLFLVGPRNKAGKESLRAIPGRMFHPALTSADKARWSVPAASWEAFQTAVWKHWPAHEGLADAVEAAKAYKAPVAAPVVAKPAPKTSVSVDGNVLKVRTPYNGGFVSEIKTLPWKTRRWNPAEKVWEVDVSKKDALVAMIAKHYGETPVVMAA